MMPENSGIKVFRNSGTEVKLFHQNMLSLFFLNSDSTLQFYCCCRHLVVSECINVF